MTERKPFLSYSDFSAILDEQAEDLGIDDETNEGKCEWNAMNAAGNAIREFYESKITSGGLMVVKTTTLVVLNNHSFCQECGSCVDPHPQFATRPNNGFCPGCGARI